jgi:glycosyltransferase involved in cell wall biosynthesis
MISVIIPTFNEEKVIVDMLRNLKNGMRGIPHEIIVTDDQSSDHTVVLAKPYADRIIVGQGVYKRTIARNRNQGASAARGTYLAFIDADITISDPSVFFTRALADFTNNPKLVGLSGYIKVFPTLATTGDRFFHGLLNRFHYLMNNVFHRGRASGEFQMVRADMFKKLSGFRADIVASEDYEFFSRLAREGRTRIDPRLVVFQTGRRAHELGWPRLLARWFMNTLSVTFTHRSSSKEWETIR